MAEFHLGDKVAVLYKGSPLSFTITSISVGTNNKPLYTGQGAQGWHTEDQLDYDLTPEQKGLRLELELAVQNLIEARTRMNETLDKVKENLPLYILRDLAMLLEEALKEPKK